MATDTIDQRFLRTAKGVAVPAHTETDRTVLAHPISSRGGNAHVHDHHLTTAEDHIPAGEAALDNDTRPWSLLLYGSILAMVVLWVAMIVRG